jgi:hypothetical protein
LLAVKSNPLPEFPKRWNNFIVSSILHGITAKNPSSPFCFRINHLKCEIWRFAICNRSSTGFRPKKVQARLPLSGWIIGWADSLAISKL